MSSGAADLPQLVENSARAGRQSAGLVTNSGKRLIVTQKTKSMFPDKYHVEPIPDIASLRSEDVIQVTQNGVTESARVVATHLDRFSVNAEAVAYKALWLGVGGLVFGASWAFVPAGGADAAINLMKVGYYTCLAGGLAMGARPLSSIVSDARGAASPRRRDARALVR
ncbi:MAG: hypothetical protein AAFX94_15085 [Myxococcota bacterium]